jgi:hypothetical protein
MPALWGNMANCQSYYQSAILLVAAYLSKGDIPLNVCSVAPDEQQILNMVFFMVFSLASTINLLISNGKKCPFTIEWA